MDTSFLCPPFKIFLGKYWKICVWTFKIFVHNWQHLAFCHITMPKPPSCLWDPVLLPTHCILLLTEELTAICMALFLSWLRTHDLGQHFSTCCGLFGLKWPCLAALPPLQWLHVFLPFGLLSSSLITPISTWNICKLYLSLPRSLSPHSFGQLGHSLFHVPALSYIGRFPRLHHAFVILSIFLVAQLISQFVMISFICLLVLLFSICLPY